MTSLDILFLVSGTTLLSAVLFGRLRLAGPVLVILYAAQIWALIHAETLFGDPVVSSWQITVLNQPMNWRYNALSSFFAILAMGAGLVSALYAVGPWLEKHLETGHSGHAFHVALAANVLSMELLLGAGNFLTLFVGLELVGLSEFFLMAMAGGVATKAALKYLAYTFSGAMAILGAIMLIHARVGSLEYGAVTEAIPSMTSGEVWALLLLMGGGFLVKMGVLPFHLWQAQAYAEAPASGSAFLGAISARMGLYDFVVVFIGIVGISRLTQLEVPFLALSSRDVLLWMAVITIILPTFVGLKQDDARYLLTWNGIGQGGFMLLGLMIGSATGTAGALFHVFGFAITQSALLLPVCAVMHRTGTFDLNQMGGLATRMPLSFVVTLVGAISLVGLPPMAGFASKWLIYRSLASEGMLPLLVLCLIGTLGTFLSAYKLVDKMFLGRLRAEHAEVRDVPSSMLAPMLALAVVILVSGVVPGSVFASITKIQAHLGVAAIDYHAIAIYHADGGVSVIWIVSALIVAVGIGAMTVAAFGGRSRFVIETESNDDRRFFNMFYSRLLLVIGPLYRAPFAWLEQALVRGINLTANGVSALYRYAQPTLFLLVTAAVVAAGAR